MAKTDGLIYLARERRFNLEELHSTVSIGLGEYSLVDPHMDRITKKGTDLCLWRDHYAPTIALGPNSQTSNRLIGRGRCRPNGRIKHRLDAKAIDNNAQPAIRLFSLEKRLQSR